MKLNIKKKKKRKEKTRTGKERGEEGKREWVHKEYTYQ
jgi:hypothetical protein